MSMNMILSILLGTICEMSMTYYPYCYVIFGGNLYDMLSLFMKCVVIESVVSEKKRITPHYKGDK